MGVNTSGVRQIAEAAGSNNAKRVACTALVLRRTSLVLGLIGMSVLLLLCRPIAQLTFGNRAHAGAIACLSLTVLFMEVANGQTALIQGKRRIGDLAAISICGAALGTILSISIICAFRENGIVPFMIAVSGLGIATSWWFARRIKLEQVSISAPLVRSEVKALLGMGLAFMASGTMTNTVSYLTRVMVIRGMSLEAAGLYQAAWGLSGVYVGFVLAAMGADYYPKLAAVAGDDSEVYRLVNEQTEAALLMAIPGILVTIAFAPTVIHMLYSPQFAPAGSILRWQILGVLGRVMSWPVGLVLLAKGCVKTFLWTEVVSNIVYLGLIWIGMKMFGLSGLGMAFFGLYIFHIGLMLGVLNRTCGFRWTNANVQLGAGAVLATAAVFVVTSGVVSARWGMALACVVIVAVSLMCAKRLAKRSGYSGLGDAWREVRTHFVVRWVR